MSGLSAEQAKNNQLALIADDDITNRMVLAKFLQKLGYNVIQSENGKQAIEAFQEHSPDIIFMDVMMPEMNGYEATTQIKYLCKNDFVPVIFLTALNDSQDLAKCVAAGGDDFLTKPLEMTVLKAKIHAIERIRDLYRQVQTLNHTLQSADEIANKVFEQAVFNKNVKVKSIKTWFKASENFNNDLFLVTHTPSNGVNILFGHFNVQGLASAVGALPASEVFRSMSKKGFAPHSIVQKINSKLYDLLPNGITLSMIFIHIDENINQALVCNFNMPDVLFIDESDNKITYQKSSIKDAIGETPRHSRDVELERVNVNTNTHIVLSSSQIFNCKNNKDELYTSENYIEAVTNGISSGNILNSVKQDILNFTDGAVFDSNLSLIEIPCSSELISHTDTLEKEIQLRSVQRPTHHVPHCNNQIQFNLQVKGRSMRTIDPVPTLLNNLESVTNIEKHQEAIFTVLTELYINALDHGVLQLDSKLKETAEGFGEYFLLRDKRLNELKDGFIKINLLLEFDESTNQLYINVEDSGNGFDVKSLDEKNNDSPSNMFSGRGIKLIRGLCERITYNDIGNQVEAVFSWESK